MAGASRKILLATFLFLSRLSTCVPTASQPQSTESSSYVDLIPRGRVDWFHAKSCSSEQAENLQSTRADLINFITIYFWFQKSGRDPYQNALDTYLGTDSIDKGSQETINDVEEVYAKAGDSTFGRGSKSTDIYIFCKDSDVKGGCGDSPLRVGTSQYESVNASSLERKEYSWLLLCEPYWKMPTFAKVLKKVDDDESIDPADMNVWFPNQALFFMASLFSMNPIINTLQPAFDTVSPLQTMNYAKQKNTVVAKKNGFSYAYAALSEWLQIVFDLSSPAVPQMNSTSANATSNSTLTPSIEKALFTPPTAFPGIPRTAGRDPDENLWVTMKREDAVDTALVAPSYSASQSFAPMASSKTVPPPPPATSVPPPMESSQNMAPPPPKASVPPPSNDPPVLPFCDRNMRKVFGSDQAGCSKYCKAYPEMSCTSVGPFPGVPGSVAIWTCDCET